MFVKEMVKQSLPLLVICGLGGIITGSTFSHMSTLFQAIPGLIVVIPGVIALRGNISTALGSRLGSAYHLGLIDADNLWNRELQQNVIGSLILSFIISGVIGVLAFGSSLLMGVQLTPVNGMILLGIVILAGAVSGVILTILTILIIFLVFKRGYDPDNVTGPALATFGDVITMLCIYGSALLIGGVL